MTRSAYAILISILVLLLIGLLSACGSTGEESRPDQGTPANPGNRGAPGPQGPVSEPAPEVVTAPMQPVYVTTSSLDSAPDGSSDDLSKLVAHSTLIVIGETPPNDPREERIQGRDPNDPSRPDPNYATIGNVYDIRVERFLKGSGDETLSVVQPIGYEAFVPGPPNTPGRITKGRDTTPNLLLQESSLVPAVPEGERTRPRTVDGDCAAIQVHALRRHGEGGEPGDVTGHRVPGPHGG